MAVNLKLCIKNPIPLDKTNLTEVELKDVQIIEAIQRYPCIWSYDHPDRQERAKVFEAWENVQADTDYEIEFCKDRWKKVRDKLRFRVKRIPASPKDEIKLQQDITTIWPIFPAMTFLLTGNRENRKMSYSEPESDVAQPSEEEWTERDRKPLKRKTRSESNVKKEVEPSAPAKKKKSSQLDSDYFFVMCLFPAIKSMTTERRLRLKMDLQSSIHQYLAQLK